MKPADQLEADWALVQREWDHIERHFDEIAKATSRMSAHPGIAFTVKDDVKVMRATREYTPVDWKELLFSVALVAFFGGMALGALVMGSALHFQ